MVIKFEPEPIKQNIELPDGVYVILNGKAHQIKAEHVIRNAQEIRVITKEEEGK